MFIIMVCAACVGVKEGIVMGRGSSGRDDSALLWQRRLFIIKTLPSSSWSSFLAFGLAHDAPPAGTTGLLRLGSSGCLLCWFLLFVCSLLTKSRDLWVIRTDSFMNQ